MVTGEVGPNRSVRTGVSRVSARYCLHSAAAEPKLQRTKEILGTQGGKSNFRLSSSKKNARKGRIDLFEEMSQLGLPWWPRG